MTAERERAVMLIKKVTDLGEFGYLNKSCIRKSVILMFFSSSRNKFTLLWQNSVTVSVGFRPPCWCPNEWAPAWRFMQIPINLGEHFFSAYVRETALT